MDFMEQTAVQSLLLQSKRCWSNDEHLSVQLNGADKVEAGILRRQFRRACGVVALTSDLLSTLIACVRLAQTRDESMVPLSINCWPSVSGGESYVNIEYEATADFDLQNVVISIPLPALSQAPRVPQACATPAIPPLSLSALHCGRPLMQVLAPQVRFAACCMTAMRDLSRIALPPTSEWSNPSAQHDLLQLTVYAVDGGGLALMLTCVHRRLMATGATTRGTACWCGALISSTTPTAAAPLSSWCRRPIRARSSQSKSASAPRRRCVTSR